MSSRKAKKPSVFDRLGPPDEEPRAKHYKRKSKDKETNSADSRRGTSSSHGGRHASHPYNHAPDASATAAEHSSEGKRSKGQSEAKTKSIDKAPHGGGKERKRSHSHLGETEAPPVKKQSNDVAFGHDRPPPQPAKESERPVSGQKRPRSQTKEEKRSSKGRTADNGLGENKPAGSIDSVPKAKRTRSDTDFSLGSDPQHADLPQATKAETRSKEGSVSDAGGGPVQRTASGGAPEVDRVAELDQEIASTQQEPAVVKKRMQTLLGLASGKHLETHSPTGMLMNVGCSERFAGAELFEGLMSVVQDELAIDVSAVVTAGGTGMEFARSLKEKKKESQSVYQSKLGAFTAVDDRRWRQRLAASSSKTSSDSKSPAGPKFNQDSYLRAVALLKLSQSKSTSTSTRILDRSVKLPRSK